MTTLQRARLDDVRHRVAETERAVGNRHADLAGTVRHSFERLRHGLDLAHARCAAVEESHWAQYVSELDRGLAELDVEMRRAAEDGPGPDAPQVLVIHATALELAGWRLRTSATDAASADSPADRLAAAEAELERYRAACTGGGSVSVAALERRVEQLRAGGEH